MNKKKKAVPLSESIEKIEKLLGEAYSLPDSPGKTKVLARLNALVDKFEKYIDERV